MNSGGTTRKRKVDENQLPSPTEASSFDGQAGGSGTQVNAVTRMPVAWLSRGSGYGARMSAFDGGYAGYCRDVQARRRMRAIPSPSAFSLADDEEEDEERGEGLDALPSRADANRLGRINVATSLACRECTSQLAIFRRMHTGPLGEVAIFGLNDCNQLGVLGGDHIDDVIRPRLLPDLKNAGIVQISAGFMHNVALAEDGSVYTWGSNDNGSLGRGGPHTPFAVEELGALRFGQGGDVILRVSAGDSRILCAGLSGRVYSFGKVWRDGRGRVWRDPVVNADTKANETLEVSMAGDDTIPVIVAGIDDAVDVQSGGSFNAALCREGKLLTWGLNEHGELGRGPPRDYDLYRANGVYYIPRQNLTPLPVTFADGMKRAVESVACGAFHLLVVTCPGQEGGGGGGDGSGAPGTRLYACGHNKFGQLGLGDERDRFRLTRVEALDRANVTSVAAGWRHSLALDDGGDVVAFGLGDYGQLGVTNGKPEAEYFENLPVHVKIPTGAGGGGGPDDEGATLDPVVQISCGYYHSLAVTEGGAVYTWGLGGESALGHGRRRDEYRPRRLDVAKGLGGAGRNTEDAARRRYEEAVGWEDADEDIEEGGAVNEEYWEEEDEDEDADADGEGGEEGEGEVEKLGDKLLVKVIQASGGGQHSVILCSVTKKWKA